MEMLNFAIGKRIVPNIGKTKLNKLITRLCRGELAALLRDGLDLKKDAAQRMGGFMAQAV